MAIKSSPTCGLRSTDVKVDAGCDQDFRIGEKGGREAVVMMLVREAETARQPSALAQYPCSVPLL